jgi:hypothetical protein
MDLEVSMVSFQTDLNFNERVYLEESTETEFG